MEGRVVWANRYAVFDEIASGGMATVYLAGRLGQVNGLRVVAVKKLFEQFAKEPDFVAMFLDEARLAARIRHPNVIKTYQVIRVPGSLAIVMEVIIGVSFVELLRASRSVGEAGRVPLPSPLAGAVVVGALRGLHAAHEACDETGTPFGLVHRDISPHNILVGKDGIPRVIDFGIAKAAGRLQNTDAGVTKGKFAYMAPEQLRGSDVDRRTDVYSAGVVLWEALTGRRLFTAASEIALITKRSSGQHVAAPPSSHNEALSKAADDVILRALHSDPAQRYATAEEMARAVEEVIGVAPEATVSAWVQSSADGKLRDLQAKYHAVEAAIDDGYLDELTQVTGPISLRGAGPPSLVFDIPDLDLARPSPPPRVSSSAPPPSRRSFAAPVEMSLEAAPSIDLDVQPARPSPRPPRPVGAVPTAAPTTALALAPRSSTPPPVPASRAAPRSSSRSSAPRTWIRLDSFARTSALLALAAGALIVFAKEGVPALVRSLAARAAQQRGFTLSADSAKVGMGELTLEGTSLVLSRTGCSIRVDAAEMQVTLDGWGSAEKLTIPSFRMTITGAATDVGHCVAAWSTEPHPSTEVSASAGELLWPEALVPGVTLQAQGVSVMLARLDVIDLHVAAPLLTMKVDGTSLGPWPVSLEVSPEQAKVFVSLDAAHPGAAPDVTVVVRPDLGMLFSIAIPRTSPASIGLPPTFLHTGPSGEVSVALEGQVFPTGTPITANGKVGVYGVTLASFGGAPKADVVAEASLSGPAGEPLKLDKGKLDVRGVTTPLTGFVSLDRGSLRLQLDHPVSAKGATTASEPIIIDTRSWTHQAGSSPSASVSAAAPLPSAARPR